MESQTLHPRGLCLKLGEHPEAVSRVNIMYAILYLQGKSIDNVINSLGRHNKARLKPLARAKQAQIEISLEITSSLNIIFTVF